ncbi:MAG: spore coat protein CotJB [Clostridia bacterium]|nr:spore coat protein CotJB [Clostridia bacterium]
MMLSNRNNSSTSKEKLLRALQTYSFMVYDTLLYLDAYPDNKEALNNYNKYKKLEMRAKMEYESKYGPITAPSEANSWQWTEGPWPWQVDKEVR